MALGIWVARVRPQKRPDSVGTHSKVGRAMRGSVGSLRMATQEGGASPAPTKAIGSTEHRLKPMPRLVG